MSSQASSSRRPKTLQRVGDESDTTGWEDESFEQTFDEIIKEESEADPSPSNSVTNERSRRLPSSPGSSRRRRHVVGTNTSTDISRRSRPPKARKDAASHRLPRHQEDEDPLYKDITPEVIRGATKVFLFTFSYLFDILTGILYLAKPLFTLIIAIYILSLLVGRLSSSIQTVLQPICILPGTSSIPLCAHLALKPRQADFRELVERQTTSFEQILDQSVGGSTLALEVKKSELATKDLLILVRASELKSSTSIADSLVRFIKDAKRASDGLQLLSSHIQFTVDSIVSVNDYALVSIQQARDRETSMTALQLLNPFAMSTQDVVVAKFTDAMDHVSERVNHLLLEGETQLQNLEHLEQHLDVLSEIVGREGLSISSERDDVLASLWTHLGANRVKLRRFSSELALLRAITDYRKRALVHVVSAIHTLQEMKSDLEVIRERVSTPGLAGSSIPVEVHLTSIQSGLTRLKQSRLNAQERERKALDTIMNSLP